MVSLLKQSLVDLFFFSNCFTIKGQTIQQTMQRTFIGAQNLTAL